MLAIRFICLLFLVGCFWYIDEYIKDKEGQKSNKRMIPILGIAVATILFFAS